eukprot:s876_g29.t1
MIDWVNALVRAPAGRGIADGYGRYWGLLEGLNAGLAFTWLSDHVQATVHAERVRELGQDPLIALIRLRLQKVGDVDKAVIRHLIAQEIPGERPRDESLVNAAWSFDPVREPMQICKLSSGPYARRVNFGWRVWTCPTCRAGLSMNCCNLSQVGPLNDMQIQDILLGKDMDRSVRRPRQSGWEGASLAPGWCADLIPPQADIIDFIKDRSWQPLAVLYGGVQSMPAWEGHGIWRAQQGSVINGAVLRFLLSGAVSWELEGQDVSMPVANEVFATPPSCVANCVCLSELPVVSGRATSFESTHHQVVFHHLVSPVQPWAVVRALAVAETVGHHFEQQMKESNFGDYTITNEAEGKKKRRKRRAQDDGVGTSVTKSRNEDPEGGGKSHGGTASTAGDVSSLPSVSKVRHEPGAEAGKRER